MIKKLLLTIFFLICIRLIAQPIPSDIKSVVSFIYVLNNKGELLPNGTSFFISVGKDSLYYGYLITAKHVLKPDPYKNDFFPFVFVRLNRKDGTSQFLRLDLTLAGKDKNVFTHADTTVDIAVIPALPDQKIYDAKYLPDNFITTKEDYKNLNIREGSNVFFTGMFTPYTGEQRNYPIVRFGKVALVTDEKIQWDSMKADLYLIESPSYGGNSGSPVFFYLGAEREAGSINVGPPIIKLAGIMMGSFNDANPIKFVETKVTPVSISNMGISAIVPAYKLHEILFSDEIKRTRK